MLLLNIIKTKRYFFLSLLAISLMSCKPLNFLYKEIKSLGYITYTTPLKDAGPGTLLGGNPKGLKLVAPPEACFPKEVQENKEKSKDSLDGDIETTSNIIKAEAKKLVGPKITGKTIKRQIKIDKNQGLGWSQGALGGSLGAFWLPWTPTAERAPIK